VYLITEQENLIITRNEAVPERRLSWQQKGSNCTL